MLVVSPGWITVLPTLVMWGIIALLPYNKSSPLWYLPCLSVLYDTPWKTSLTVFLNITTQSHHIFLDFTGQTCHTPNHGITLVEKVMEKRMGPGNSTWDYRWPTILACNIPQVLLLLFPLLPLWTEVFIIYALPSVRRLKLLINNDIDTKEKSQTYRVIRK